jgi:GNAT superfamily N-acetyltransferase
MTAEEYARWQDEKLRSYAAEMVGSGRLDAESAHRRAEEQHREFLPEGLATPHTHLLRVLDGAGAAVGALWVGPHPLKAGAGWVYDVEIEERRRGEGLGRAAMLAAEDLAREEGWTEIGLNVFGPNHGAKALYDSLGYAVVSTTMSKPLP